MKSVEFFFRKIAFFSKMKQSLKLSLTTMAYSYFSGIPSINKAAPSAVVKKEI